MAALGDIAIGGILNIPMADGSIRAGLVVNQGIPSNSPLYDDSCDGTWILFKDIYTNHAWENSINDYKNSEINSYLNGNFLNLLGNNIRDALKQIKIPYQDGTDTGSSVVSGANGLSCKIFLLSGYELGLTVMDDSSLPKDGARLSYFDSGTSESARQKRIAYYKSNIAIWWLRSRGNGFNYTVFAVGTSGFIGTHGSSYIYGVRPAFILPPDLPVKQNADGSFSITVKKPFYITAGGENVEVSPYIQAGGELVACDITATEG